MNVYPSNSRGSEVCHLSFYSALSFYISITFFLACLMLTGDARPQFFEEQGDAREQRSDDGKL